MKSVTIALAATMATLTTASLSQYQQPSDVCAVTKTVTIVDYQPHDTAAPGQYNPGSSGGQYNPVNPAQYSYPAVTVTVTETAPQVTITDSITVTHTVKPGNSDYSVTSKDGSYTPPASPPEYTAISGHYRNTTTAPASRQTHRVEVGTFDGKVRFIPNSVNAEIGDVVEYDILIKSHSLIQSEFLTPCTYNGGFDTGLNQPNPKNQTGLFVIPFEVTTKKPQWFYCKQQGPPNHCGKGMVFGLNPGNKMDQFIRNAINQNGNSTGVASSTAPYPTATSTSTPSASTAAGAVTTVTVGLQNGTVLKFDPPYLPKVPIGQKIHFDFRAANHTLTESSLYAPCKKLAGTEVDTNFQNVNKADIPEFKPFDLVIDSDKPRFFYCKQKNGTPDGHCGKGMVFAVNADGATFSQFEQNALAASVPKIKGRVAAA